MTQEPKIENLPTGDLIPYAGNSRTHDAAQVGQIAASIKEFGFTNPVLIDADNGIIAGHGRLLAAQQLKLDQVPCIRLGYLTDAQKRAYVIADNKLALNAGWDEEALSAEIARLEEDGFDIDLTGFDLEELGQLLCGDETASMEKDDEIPEAPLEANTVVGDVWILGNHRLMCGNSTSVDAVDKLLNGDDWDVCVFDPPYEIETLYSDAMQMPAEGKKLISFWDFKRFGIASKTAMDAGWKPLYELVWDNVTSWFTPNRPLAKHKACGIFGDDPQWNFDSAIINDGKNRTAKKVSNSRGDYDYKPLDGAVHLRTVESFPTTSESGGHDHSKPIKWIEAIFRGVGGNSFLDLFGGSGSTLIACEHIGVKSYTMEMNPLYCDVIIERWENFTGKKAELKNNACNAPINIGVCDNAEGQS